MLRSLHKVAQVYGNRLLLQFNSLELRLSVQVVVAAAEAAGLNKGRLRSSFSYNDIAVGYRAYQTRMGIIRRDSNHCLVTFVGLARRCCVAICTS